MSEHEIDALKERIADLEKLNAERRKAEERIKRSAEEWQRTFDSISDLIFLQDKDFTIIRVNKAFADAFKMKPEDIVGKKCYQLLHKRDAPWPECPLEKTLHDGKTHAEEVDDPNIGIPLLVTTSPLLDDKGQVAGSVHIAKDISDIKKTKQDLELKIRDLECFQKVTMDRENRIIELKEEVKKLKTEAR